MIQDRTVVAREPGRCAEGREAALGQQVHELRFSIRRLQYANLELDGQLRAEEQRCWEMVQKVDELKAEVERLTAERDYHDEILTPRLQAALIENAEMRNQLRRLDHRLADRVFALLRRTPLMVPALRGLRGLVRKVRR
jgi:predicted RNase H-like nuclease (RuvC/YqgF family)